MHPTLVILVVGLTPRHLGPHTPKLSALASAGAARSLTTITPAVTCSVQATFMTGGLPRDHGIVANGWLFRDQMEVWLWRQSNRLVEGEKIWEAAKHRDASFTSANLFWWYNIAASHDIGVKLARTAASRICRSSASIRGRAAILAFRGRKVAIWPTSSPGYGCARTTTSMHIPSVGSTL